MKGSVSTEKAPGYDFRELDFHPLGEVLGYNLMKKPILPDGRNLKSYVS
jgi:hypothetical protein